MQNIKKDHYKKQLPEKKSEGNIFIRKKEEHLWSDSFDHWFSSHVIDLRRKKNDRNHIKKEKRSFFDFLPKKRGQNTVNFVSRLQQKKISVSALPKEKKSLSSVLYFSHAWIRKGVFSSILFFIGISFLLVSPFQALSWVGEETRNHVSLENELEKIQEELKEGSTKLFGDYPNDALAHFYNAQEFFRALRFNSQFNWIPSFKETIELGEKISFVGALMSRQLGQRGEIHIDEILLLTDEILSGLEKVKDKSEFFGEIFDLKIPFEKLLSFFPEEDKENRLSLVFKIFLRVFLATDEKRYLVVFQNPSEIRPTGGFLGSFGMFTVAKGKIIDQWIPPQGTYALQGQLKSFIESPLPMHSINTRWELQDANWYFDFPSSARKIEEFYEDARGESIDGVIAINASLLKEFLQITGPISLPHYEMEITSENALENIQIFTQEKHEEFNKSPKQIIADLQELIFLRIKNFSFQEKLSVLEIFSRALEQKNIQIYFDDVLLEKDISTLGWDGRIEDTSGDYLAVVHTNIGGEKTDAVIFEEITHISEIDTEGNIIDELRIKREHRGKENTLFTGAENRDFIRVYVPAGSTFLKAEGFDDPPNFSKEESLPNFSYDDKLLLEEGAKWFDSKSNTGVSQDFHKTIFENWMLLSPGETQEAVIRYKIPQRIILPSSQNTLIQFLFPQSYQNNYQFYFQKQSGMEQQTLVKEIRFGKNFLPTFLYPIARKQSDESLQFNKMQSLSDLFFTVTFAQ